MISHRSNEIRNVFIWYPRGKFNSAPLSVTVRKHLRFLKILFSLCNRYPINMLNLHRNRIFTRSLFTGARRLNHDEPQNTQLASIKNKIEKDKKKLQWRTPYSDRPDSFQSSFKLFAPTNRNSELVELMQQPVDLSPSAIKKWWQSRKDGTEAFMQKFIPERHSTLGEDLASAHFVVHRGGSVR